MTKEKQVPGDFNWEYYLDHYPDLRQNGVDTKEKAIRHWINFGNKEGRQYRKYPFKIIVLGLPKTGTTALFFKIKNSLPKNIKCLFEPKKYIEEKEDSEKGVIAKVLFGHIDIDFFSSFDKKILIVRDPRDWCISRFLYSVFYVGNYKNGNFIKEKIELLKKKEKSPGKVLLKDCMKENLSKPLDKVIDFQKTHKDFFILKYEDFVDDKLPDLENYLGFKLTGTSKVPESFKRVERTKDYGDWKNWFTEEDIEYFKPMFERYMKEYNYWDDWKLNEKQVILPEYASEYAKRIVNERRRNENIPELKFSGDYTKKLKNSFLKWIYSFKNSNLSLDKEDFSLK